MRLRRLGPATGTLAAGALAACGLGGCTWIQGFTAQKPPAAAPQPPRAKTSPIAPDLKMISSLPQGDPANQAEVFQAAKDAAQLTPTTTNKLRYALALATPGYSGSDPVAAERQLSQILARPETLLPEERMLAIVELKQVEQRLILQAENTRLQREAARNVHDKLSAINRRLTAEMVENVRLRKALEDARAKLEAVSHIERAINDRGAGASPPR
ncbi:MAG TPA: hypothetical protein VMV25_03210 [Steroidobacteraceae bacterium]|nr:hypothetical protein [Steroidobacteraceae bacterium]